MLDLAFMGKVLPLYYEGALLTLRVGAIGILLALAVGMVTAVARYWRIPILNTAAVIYLEKHPASRTAFLSVFRSPQSRHSDFR